MANASFEFSLDSTVSIYYSNRAVSKMKIKDFFGAIEDYTKIIDFNNDDPNSYMKRGGAKYIMNDIDGACEDWTMANKLGSKDAKEKIEINCKVFQMKQKLRSN